MWDEISRQNFIWEIFSHIGSCGTSYVIASGLALPASTRCVSAKQSNVGENPMAKASDGENLCQRDGGQTMVLPFAERVPVRLVRRSAMVAHSAVCCRAGEAGHCRRFLPEGFQVPGCQASRQKALPEVCIPPPASFGPISKNTCLG